MERFLLNSSPARVAGLSFHRSTLKCWEAGGTVKAPLIVAQCHDNTGLPDAAYRRRAGAGSCRQLRSSPVELTTSRTTVRNVVRERPHRAKLCATARTGLDRGHTE